MMNALGEPTPLLSAQEKRARLAERLRVASRRETQSPLSFAQQRLWFLDQLEPGSPLYNVPSVACLLGSLNVGALEKSLASIVARHEALRTAFQNPGETPVQVVSSQLDFKLAVITAENPAEAEKRVREEVTRPFNIMGAAPLLRATLVRLPDHENWLVLNLHHIVADEWSLKILFRELEEFYTAEIDGRQARLPELPIQYADYAAWQRQWLEGDSLRDQLRYWKNQLSGAPPLTELTTDRPRGRAATFAGRTATRTLVLDLGPRLKKLAADRNSTLFMVLLAGFKALIHRYSSLEDIIIGTPVAGRNRMETEGLIGFFVNTLLMRSSAAGDPTFEEMLQRVRATALGAYAHQELPFDKLVEALRPERSSSHLAFTRIMFSLQTRPEGKAPLALPGLKVEEIEVDTGTSKFDLTFVVQDFGGQLTVRLEYNSGLFDAPTIERLMEHFENLLRGAAAQPALHLSELPLMGEAERAQLLVEWNDTADDYPRQKCIHQLFEERARLNPAAVAVVFGKDTVTYGDLNSRANQLAHCLLRHKVAPGAPVAICLDRSVRMVVGFLAILKAGGAYVPLDPRYPKERLAFMLADTRTSVVLTQHSLLPHLPRRGLAIICLDDHETLAATESIENPPHRTKPEDTAYIIYTSGSTGKPKGVAVPHRAVNRLVLNTNYIVLDETDRMAQVSNISFDAATFEIWGALLNGGQLRGITSDVALSPVEFARDLREQGITAMFLTSALFSQLAAEVPGAFATLRTLMAGGEALDPKWVRAVLKEGPPLRLVNGYGPTENTTFTCCCLLRDIPENAASVPIGKPISNTQVYILDSHRNPVPVGVPGELYTGGDGLAKGYWNRPELTAEKFILHQFTKDGPCHCLYRTGDLARYLPDGNIEFLGRMDNQVKIRGFRVELGEIEAVLSRHSGVRECAVKVSGSGAGQTRLVGYIVAKGKRAPNGSQLRGFMAGKLPDYMVPSAFVTIAALPLTVNGKVDRRALPEPERGRPAMERKYASPRDAVELELIRIWESVLGIEPIGIEDHFFDLGGHSLMAVRVAARIAKTFGKKLPLSSIFMAPTIEKLAVVIRDEIRGETAAARTSIVELQPKGTQPPIFLVHGAGGGMFWGYVNLARRLGPDQPVFGLSSRGLEGRDELATIQEMAAQYISDMRATQPRGPYYLGGYCFGGNVAFEMARQLEAKGEKVALLALFNCAPPNSNYLRPRWTPTWGARLVRNLFYWAGYCRQWTPTQRRDFLHWKVARLKHWLTQLGGAVIRDTPAVQAENLVDLSSLPEQQRGLWQSHIRALIQFHPQPYEGQVHLFRSPGHPLWCSFEPDYGWGELAAQGVAISIVPGAHEKILEEPWVEMTAAALKQVLEASHEDDLVFWKRELAGAPQVLELPADHPRPAVRTRNVASETRTLPKTLFPSHDGMDPSVLVLAAFNLVLHRYTGQDDLLIGEQIGLHQKSANVVALRTSFAGNPSGRELLNRLRGVRMSARQHAKLPFKEVLAELCPAPDAACHPLVQVFFAQTSGLAPDGFDLCLSLANEDEAPVLRLEYAADLFDRATIQRMLGHIEVALKQLAEKPDSPPAESSILTPAESDLLLQDWNRTEKDYPRDKTLSRLFEEQVARTPTAEALVCGTKRLTYRELFERSMRVAGRLRALGVGNESRVGICLERSEDMVAGILGTLQAGGAYVPLDPAYPKGRLALIAQDAGLRVLLTRRKLRPLLPVSNTPVLCVEDLAEEEGNSLFPCPSGPSDLAYVLYTSGSTGQPKGVALEHRNAVALVSWAKDIFTREQIAGVLASTSICFDLSVFELFVPLCWGGKVILADNALALPDLPAAHEVTLINTVPSAIRELLRIKGVPASVRVVNLAGEPLATPLVDQIYRETSAAKVYDLYGPTETTTYSTFTLRKPGEPPTIGRPLANEQVFVLDKHFQPMPVGVPGDLYIGGAGVARGYLNRPEWTAERFLTLPILPGARLYKTGDIARWRDDGNLVFLGRSDHQVKIRGFRIELGEIESVLKSHAGVAEVVVMAREDRPGEKRIAAYVVIAPGAEVTVESLRQRVREKLPEYMTPASFTFLPRLPMTPNGKVDRRALPVPQAEQRDLDDSFVTPRPGVETDIAAIWSEVLGLKKISARDNFFELGGHSLLAIQVISRLRTTLKIEAPLSCLFEAPTVEALAAGVASNRWKTDESSIPPLEPAARDKALPASFMQEQLWFLYQLDPASDAYNVPAAIRFKGPLDLNAFQQSLDMIVQKHEALRTTLRSSDGCLSQIINPSVAVKLGHMDLPGGSEGQLLEVLQKEARRPFDLETGPLIRASVARLSEKDHALIIVMHHAVTDGWSLDILFRELEANYKALTAGDPARTASAPAIQYADFACWQRRWMEGEHLAKELGYWKEKLAGAPLAVNLPTDTRGPAPVTSRVARRNIVLPEQLCGQLTQLGRAEGSTTFMVLMAALAIALHKWTEQTDLVLGTVVAGRSRREIEDLIGCFMNFLPLRVKIAGPETGLEVLRAVKAEVVESQTHQDCPFKKIVEAVAVERGLNRNPIYNAALLFQNIPTVPRLTAGLDSSFIDVYSEAALLDLRFEANEAGRGLALMCEYKADLFEGTTIEHLLASVRHALETLIQTPDARILDFKLSPELENQARASRARTQAETITITSTFTAEPVELPLRYWLNELEIPATIKFAPYNQVFQQLLDPASALSTNRRGLNILLIRTQDWQSPQAGAPALEHDLKHHAREFVGALQSALARGGAPTLVCFCPRSLQALRDQSKSRELDEVENSMAAALAGLGAAQVVTAQELQTLYPVSDYDDPAGEELGHIPYSALFFTALGTCLARKFHVLRRPACKVIALDCDQTLWSGVCGEDGPNGIRLDPPRLALQEFMRRQQEAGKLLVVCSKNDEADVNAVFDQGRPMPLKKEHFTAWRVNWRQKSESLKSIARELKLGLDSFILIDDNPLECAEVEANCPEVLTLQLPEDPARIPQFLDHCWAFDQARTTDEDRNRTEMYRQNRMREELQAASMSFADFIDGLKLQVDISRATPAQLERVAQLTQRTNQFNASGKRRTEAELRQMEGGLEVWTVSVKDRFGDYGLVGAIIVAPEKQALVADSFLLSCRALGRGVEHRMLAHLGKIAGERGAQWVDIPFARSQRNQPALDFLESVGSAYQKPTGDTQCFHFPAQFAAEVALNPAQAAQAPLLEAGTPKTNGKTSARKFTQCRAIALESGDATRIHEKIEGRLALRPAQRGDYAPPRTQQERLLCELWQKLLRVERVGIDDDFFDLGGHSLLAVRLFAEVEKATGRKLPLVTLFQAPTIAQLASVLAQDQTSGSQSVLVPIQPRGHKPPLYLIHGAGGDVLWGYANLVAHMDPEQPIFALKSRGQTGQDEFERLEDMAAFYLQVIRTHQPEGPYFLGGYCFGGNVAYEMARQLQADGARVGLLALLDSAPSNVGYETVLWWRPEFIGLFARNSYYWLQDFQNVKPRDRWRFAARKLRTFGRKLSRWVRPGHDSAAVDLEAVIDPSHFPERELELWKIHLRALAEHVQRPYAGSVTLFRTRGHPLFSSFARDLRWSTVVGGGIDVQLIPGSHENIFMEPHVRSLAQGLTESLSHAQEQFDSENKSPLLQNDAA